MTIQELLARIVGLSHQEDTPDTGLQAKALGWLNNAYLELMAELQPFQRDALHTVTTLTTNTVGKGELPSTPQRVLSVVDATHKAPLRYMSTEEFTEEYPLPVEEGQPHVYRLNGNRIEVYPMAVVELNVTYVPIPTVLRLEDEGTAIQLPETCHQALIWGALVWGSLYERGFTSANDIKLFQTKWEEAKRAAKLSLINKGGKAMRTQPMEG